MWRAYITVNEIGEENNEAELNYFLFEKQMTALMLLNIDKK